MKYYLTEINVFKDRMERRNDGLTNVIKRGKGSPNKARNTLWNFSIYSSKDWIFTHNAKNKSIAEAFSHQMRYEATLNILIQSEKEILEC